jgi:hypothetical protein
MSTAKSRSGVRVLDSFTRLKIIFFAGLIVAGGPLAFSQVTIQGRRADRFVDSMGINVHVESSIPPYNNYAAINRSLQALGMRHFRDEINDTDSSFVNEINAIGALGYTLCGLIEGGNDYPPPGQRLESSLVVPMIHNLQPTIEAVEGPNEPDNSSFSYNGSAYPKGAIEESKDLWNIVKGSPELNALPVLVMSEASAPDFLQIAAVTPPPINYATYGNMHAYQGGNIADYGLSTWYIPYSRDLTGNDALWTTETGYHNYTEYLSDGEQQGVSERASAIYLPIAFLSGFNRGVMRTFSYELIDEAYDPRLTSGSGEGHYGLLNSDFTAKPAYDALKNLISILKEPEKQFTPGSLTITFSGEPGTLRYTLLQKPTGIYYLALWNDIPVYRVATPQSSGRDLYPADMPVKLTFQSVFNVTVYAPNDPTGADPTTAFTVSTAPLSITLRLPPQVLILEIRPPNP